MQDVRPADDSMQIIQAIALTESPAESSIHENRSTGIEDSGAASPHFRFPDLAAWEIDGVGIQPPIRSDRGQGVSFGEQKVELQLERTQESSADKGDFHTC